MLRQYVYVSTANGHGPDVIKSILESCLRNNAARGITGLLLYNGRNFLQVLEGDVEDLSWLMRRIDSDPRHAGISIIEDVAAKSRAFPDWEMRHIKLVENIDERRASLEQVLPLDLEPHVRRVILNFTVLN